MRTCFSRAVSGTPAKSGASPTGCGGDLRSDRGQLVFWLAIIDGLAAVYILPTVIGIARQVEDLGLVICLNTIPVGWPAALILACMMPRKPIR